MFCSNILVPFDGSMPSKKALNKALELSALDTRIKLNIIHVINLHTSVHNLPGVENIFYEDGEQVLAEAEKIACDYDVSCQTELLTGTPASAILDYCKKHGCDLIIMGSRGLGGIKEFLGSVSHTVVHEAPAPVLIIKA